MVAIVVMPPVEFTRRQRLDNGATFYASIVDSGQELFVLQTTPGVIASGVASLQSKRGDDDGSEGGSSGACRIAVTRGVYGFISQGTGAPPTVQPPAAGPLAGVGTVSFSPNGSFKLTAVRSANGLHRPATAQPHRQLSLPRRTATSR